MKLTKNVHIGINQINNPSPDKVKFFVNATIIICGTIIAPTLEITPSNWIPAMTALFLYKFMLILCGGLKGIEKLLGDNSQTKSNAN